MICMFHSLQVAVDAAPTMSADLPRPQPDGAASYTNTETKSPHRTTVSSF